MSISVNREPTVVTSSAEAMGKRAPARPLDQETSMLRRALAEYRWGGTSCGSRTLPDSHVAMLQRALERQGTIVQPRFQIGQGDLKCLVGFNLVD
jgi:hypothetical protein